ncbi:MAG TPA: hypothetical protein VIQ77_09320 [Mucilaginibacter sp.]
MIRKIIITLSLIIACIGGQAQTYTAKDLIGRWEFSRNKKANLIFSSDSTGAWLQQDGFIFNRFKYTSGTQKPGDRYMEFKFTIEPKRKHPKYVSGYIKLLNDSVALMRIGWPIGKNADTTYKHGAVLRKIKQPLLSNAPRLPTYKDLLGNWRTYFKKKVMSTGVRFIDSIHVVFTYTDRERAMNYQINFTQQPTPIDFSDGSGVFHGYLVFESYNYIRLELFEPDNERPDHFTVFGHNTIMQRQKDGVEADAKDIAAPSADR